MKFYVELKLNRKEDAKDLSKAFLSHLGVEGNLRVNEMKAYLEIISKEIPTELFDAITDVGTIQKIRYANEVSEKQKEKNGSKQDVLSQPKEAKKVEPVSIPQLEEIAKKATSFENFAELIAEWLEMGKKTEYFKNLVMATAEADEITWKNLENILDKKAVVYKTNDKLWATKRVAEKLKEESIKIMQLLIAIGEYKDYSFGETISSKPRVKLECMPEIQSFEEVLAGVDKTRPVEERVLYVLDSMGLEEIDSEKKEFCIKIANTAVRKKEIVADAILEEANIPVVDRGIAEMSFSEFLNNFVKKYDSEKKVKVFAFLSELQKVIMLDTELN